MEIENSQHGIRLALLRLGAVNCLGVGLAMLSLSAKCQLFLYGCRTIDFSGYMFLGLMAVAGASSSNGVSVAGLELARIGGERM